jgi:hypothetical protein
MYIRNRNAALKSRIRTSELSGLSAKSDESVTMGWVWRDDEEDEFDSSAGGVSSGERCSTRKVVKSQCRTEEVEPGKFIRKCEKTEQVLKECVGKYVSIFIYLLLVWLPRKMF